MDRVRSSFSALLLILTLVVVAIAARSTRAEALTSVPPGGIQRLGVTSFDDASADGRYVVFSSAAPLVGEDTNGVPDVFRLDRGSGSLERISVSSTELQANRGSSGASISADGRFIAFRSAASNLVPGDTNGVGDVFVRDVVAGTTFRASVRNDETQADGRSFFGSVSDDGRFVAFESNALNLLVPPGGQFGYNDGIYVRDRLAGTTKKIVDYDDLNNQGVFAGLGRPKVSGDGSVVLWSARFSGTSGDSDYDELNLTTTSTLTQTLVDTATFWSGADLSTDGTRVVAWTATRAPLGSFDVPAQEVTSVFDLATHTTKRFPGTSAAISSDGSTAFSGGDVLRAFDIGSGRIELLRVGTRPFDVVGALSDGAGVLVGTDTPNLVPSDTSLTTDFFLVGAGSAPPTPTLAHVHDIALQPDGRIVVSGDRELADGQRRLVIARYTASGSLDPTFSGDGLILSGRAATDSRLVVQPGTNRVIVALDPMRVFAFTSAGLPDASFTSWTNASARQLGDLRIDPGGRIIVTGSFGSESNYCEFNPWSFYSCSEIALARLNPNGKPDTTFDGDGVATFGRESEDMLGLSVAFLGDGYVVASTSGVVHFGATGIFDMSFGDEGFAGPRGGGVLVVGGRPLIVEESDGVLSVTRLEVDGDVDLTYGVLGTRSIRIAPTGTDAGFAGLARAGSGRLYVLGWGEAIEGTPVFVVIRLTDTGARDATFSGDGLRSVRPTAGGWGVMEAGASTPSAGLFLGGSVAPSWDRSLAFGLVGLTSDGAFDPAFGGGDGRVFTRFSNP